jgi:hypothetical protein
MASKKGIRTRGFWRTGPESETAPVRVLMKDGVPSDDVIQPAPVPHAKKGKRRRGNEVRLVYGQSRN